VHHRELFPGLVKLHILYHAGKEPAFGFELMRELGRRGYCLSPGTLYPLLHKLRLTCLLSSKRKNVAGRIRTCCRITSRKRAVPREGTEKARELPAEIHRGAR